jgi:signal transduction histidine kinase
LTVLEASLPLTTARPLADTPVPGPAARREAPGVPGAPGAPQGGTWTGPSAEMRRFSAGMRAIVAMLCTLLLFGSAQPPGAATAALLLAYGTWSAYVLWTEASGRPLGRPLLHYWVDVVWTATMLQLSATGSGMLILTLVQPVVLASIGYGVRRGVQLAAFGALAVIVDFGNPLVHNLSQSVVHALPALGVLSLVPSAALLARPMSVLRQRLALVSDIEARLDPRRGLEAVAETLVEQLRVGTGAQVVGLVLPSANGAPATLATADDPSFRTSTEVHQRLEALLADTPDHPLTHVRRQRWRPVAGTRVHGGQAATPRLRERLDALAELLEVRTIIVVPLTRYGRRHGHLLLGLPVAANRNQDVAALAHAAPELLRVVEQAALVDQLQDESASHERARIGRDLHDSAIQPYLGLKYAVETVALRIPRDNAARAEVDALADLVNSEVAALRELISGLRTGAAPGDDALVPAVRRQVRRFSLLFGIDVEIDCPDSLATTRALADSLFHMVNEALNNIRKHSGARHVWLRMAIVDKVFQLVLRDDAGTLAGKPAAPFQPLSLTERATELGGRVQISQPDGLNTELVIQIPLA